MKLKLFIFFTVLTSLVQAQVDVSLKTIGLLTGQLGAEVEYLPKDNLGIALGVYSSDLAAAGSFSLSEEVYNATQFAIAPEVRYYFDPDDAGDGGFIGVYLRNINNTPKSKIYNTDNVFNGSGYTNITADYTHTMNQTFIGVNLGAKYTFGSDDKFFMSYNYGFGVAVAKSITWDDPTSPIQTGTYAPEKPEFKSSSVENNFTDKIDLRMNFAIGYRFGNGSSKSKSSTKKSDDI